MFLFRQIIPKAKFIKVTKNILLNNFTPDEIENIIAQYNKHHREVLSQHLKYESTGVRFLLKLACKNIALYRTLLSHHVEKDKALFYLENVQCEYTSNFASLIYRLSGLACRDAQRRLEWLDKFIWKFLFAQPFHRISYSMDENSLSFKVIRCPIADYFQAHNQSELCRSTFCNLYYHWAEIANVMLDRSQTLVSGASYCDFRFQIITEKIHENH